LRHFRRVPTWWIRAETEPGIRADLVALGIRLGWIVAEDKEELAVAEIIERLRHEGEGILLIFDNAVSAKALKPYLPRGGVARVLITSNAHAWRGMAIPVEIREWPKEIGADYLIARTAREPELAAAETLSQALGGLPLAHEQAAAYCERLDVSFADYRKRFEAAPTRFLDDARHAPAEYHEGLTVTKTFSLAIEEAGKLHPAAEPLIVHSALLAPDLIPLFLFSTAREKFGEPLAAALSDDGLDEAVAALRAFALVDREMIQDERQASTRTDAIRLHRLVREVAAGRCKGELREQFRRALVAALATVFPEDGYDNPTAWPRCAPLTPHILSICEAGTAQAGGGAECGELLNRVGAYFHARAAYSAARSLFERALAIRVTALGSEHPKTAQSLDSLARLLHDQGDLAAAQPLAERALAIRETALGLEHPDTARSLSTFAGLLLARGDLTGARLLFERALAIREKVLGPEHPDTAWSLADSVSLLRDDGDLVGARRVVECALAIRERVLGFEHPDTAASLATLASVLRTQGDIIGARCLSERALATHEKILGREHPKTALSLHSLANVLRIQNDLAEARRLLERAVAIHEAILGPEHPDTAWSLTSLAAVLQDQGDLPEAKRLFERALAIREGVFGFEHPDAGWGLAYLAFLRQAQGDFVGARELGERALVIHERAFGLEGPTTAQSLFNLACLLEDQGDLVRSQSLFERALAIREKVFGSEHLYTAWSLNALASILRDKGDLAEAQPFGERALTIVNGRPAPRITTWHGASPYSPTSFRTRGTLQGRSRSASARWRSMKRDSAAGIPQPRGTSPNSPFWLKPWATTEVAGRARVGTQRTTAGPRRP
jgi:tetratricopeptide (TPR) repeat protein